MFICSPEALANMEAVSFAVRNRDIPTEEQCVNFGADECLGRAEENGWCKGCSAELFPPRPFIPDPDVPAKP